MSRLSGKELTGLSFLVLIVALVVCCSLLLKRCDEPQVVTVPGPQVEMQSDSTSSSGSKSGRKRSSSGKRGGRKRGGGGKAGSAKEKAAIPDRDPFSDTIPTEF